MASSSPKTGPKTILGKPSNFHTRKMNHHQKSTISAPHLINAPQHSLLSTALCVSEESKGGILQNKAYSSPKTGLKIKLGKPSNFHTRKMNRYQKSTVRVPHLINALQHSLLSTALCVSEESKEGILQNKAYSSPKTSLKIKLGKPSNFHTRKMNRYQKSTVRVPHLINALQHSPLSTALCVSEGGKRDILQHKAYSSPKTGLKAKLGKPSNSLVHECFADAPAARLQRANIVLKSMCKHVMILKGSHIYSIAIINRQVHESTKA